METTCKTILHARGIAFDELADIGELVKVTRKELRLLPEDVPHAAVGTHSAAPPTCRSARTMANPPLSFARWAAAPTSQVRSHERVRVESRDYEECEGLGRKVGIPHGGRPRTCPVRAVRDSTCP